jgi:hypothetical protein
MYDPPYAREIDDLFVRNLVKYLAPVSSLRVRRRTGELRMHRVESSGNDTEDGVRTVSCTTVTVEVPRSRQSSGDDTRRIGFLYEEVANETATTGDGTVPDGTVPDGTVPDGTVPNDTATPVSKMAIDADAPSLAEEPKRLALDALYRLRPEDIIHRLADVLYLVAQWEPALFSERGRTNLERLASREAQAVTVRATDPDVTLTYVDDSAACCLSLQASSTAPDCVIVRRRPAHPPAAVPARPYARSA